MTLDAEQKLLIWKQSIQTQMHFAELSIKMRQIGLTLAGGSIALAVVLYRSNAQFSLMIPFVGWAFPISSVLCGTAALTLMQLSFLT